MNEDIETEEIPDVSEWLEDDDGEEEVPLAA